MFVGIVLGLVIGSILGVITMCIVIASDRKEGWYDE